MASKPTTTKKTKVNEPVSVWSEVGVTLPIGDTYAHFRFSFGHERIAKNGTQAELKRVAALIDEFNSEELERRVDVYMNLVKRVMSEDHTVEPETKDKKGSVRDRAKKRLK